MAAGMIGGASFTSSFEVSSLEVSSLEGTPNVMPSLEGFASDAISLDGKTVSLDSCSGFTCELSIALDVLAVEVVEVATVEDGNCEVVAGSGFYENMP
jgi:hypothetical protein